MDRNVEISSVQEYMSLIDRLRENYTYQFPLYDKEGNPTEIKQTYVPRFIYRGHGDHETYKLLPGVYRENPQIGSMLPADYSLMEYNILADFISEACRYVPNIPKDDAVSWLEIAQHFGVPTRLLDFTQNPLVALYFACSKYHQTETSPGAKGSVWVINEPVYSRSLLGENTLAHAVNSKINVLKIVNEQLIYFDGFKKVDRPGAELYFPPRIYKPFYSEERMTTQSSVFMIWDLDHVDLLTFLEPHHFMSLSSEADNKPDGVIFCICIPPDKKSEIMRQLDMCGINEKFIFPGIDGIGKYISRKYKQIPF